MRKLFIISLCLMASFTAFTQVSEWRGEGRTGIFSGEELLTEWPENGPDLNWSHVNLPSGFSSPVISENTIYLAGLIDSLNYITAFSLDGSVKWQKAYGRAWTLNYIGGKSTPTLDENKLYVHSGAGEVVCMDAQTGEVIWSVDALGLFEGSYNRYGYAESLLVVGKNVLFTCGGDLTTMIALDKNSGALAWKSKSLNDMATYVSPLLIEEGGNQLVVGLTKDYLFGVNPDNGDILWTFEYGKYVEGRAYRNHSCTPIYDKGGIYITSGYNHQSVKLKISEDLSNVELDWINTDLDVHHGGVVKIDDYIYGASWENNANGLWTCIDWNTGETKYQHKWMNKGSIIAAGDFLYCYDDRQGNVGLVKINPEKFELVSSFKVTLGKRGPYWAHLVIDRGVLYVRHEDAFMAYNISTK